jgi:hypothetical protein
MTGADINHFLHGCMDNAHARASYLRRIVLAPLFKGYNIDFDILCLEWHYNPVHTASVSVMDYSGRVASIFISLIQNDGRRH